MSKNKKTDKPGFSDLVTLAKSGWTPAQVNELLDRFDAMGDLNAPDLDDLNDADDNEDDEDIDIENDDQDEPDEDEDDNVSDDDSEDDDTDASDDTKDKKKNTNKQHNLEVENTRLKKQIQKLQQKNRSKDISGGKNEKSPEQSLIDTFQSKFE